MRAEFLFPPIFLKPLVVESSQRLIDFIDNHYLPRVIEPALVEYAEELQHLIPWKGCHAFRRGLATNPYELGVKPKVIQAI